MQKKIFTSDMKIHVYPRLNFGYYITLRWLDTVFKKLNYSLLNTLNCLAVKFK